MSDSIRALYISYDGLTDPLGQSQVLPYLIRLSAKAIRFDLLTYDKSFRIRQTGLVESLQERTRRHGINWSSLRYHKRFSLLSTAYDILRGIILCRRLVKTDPSFRIVHCRGYVSSLIGIYLKKNFGLRFIFDMRGFWPEEKTDGGSWPAKGWIYRLVKRFEKKYFQQADSIVILTRTGKSYILDHPQAYRPPAEIQVIPTAVDLDHFLYHSDFKSARREFFLRTPAVEWDLRLVYSGSIGSWYKPRDMILFYAYFKQAFPNSSLTMLINNPEKEQQLRQWADESEQRLQISGLSRSMTVLSVEYSRLPEYLGRMDCSLSFIEPCFSKISSFPTKFGETLACGLPQIINSGIGDTAQIVSGYHVGWVVESFTPQAYQSTIGRIPALLRSSPDCFLRCRQTAEEWLSVDRLSDTYYSIYSRLNSRNPAGLI
ncbi:MAG: glycosyltransferase [Candidatus Delongbacteria bacterium]|nr:glycosyltransferase [Candidatus Delongbacteria bacterium]